MPAWEFKAESGPLLKQKNTQRIEHSAKSEGAIPSAPFPLDGGRLGWGCKLGEFR